MNKEVLDYIIANIPAIISVLTTLAGLVAAISQVKKISSDTSKENKELKIQNARMRKENAELKNTLNCVLKKVYKVDCLPNENKGK